MPTVQREHLRVYGRVTAETTKAIKVHFEIDERDVWIPLSQVSYIKRGTDLDELHVSEWFCRKEGLDAE